MFTVGGISGCRRRAEALPYRWMPPPRQANPGPTPATTPTRRAGLARPTPLTCARSVGLSNVVGGPRPALQDTARERLSVVLFGQRLRRRKRYVLERSWIVKHKKPAKRRVSTSQDDRSLLFQSETPRMLIRLVLADASTRKRRH